MNWRKIAVLAAILLIIMIRLVGILKGDNIRAVDFLVIFVGGAIFGVLVMSLVRMYKNL